MKSYLVQAGKETLLSVHRKVKEILLVLDKDVIVLMIVRTVNKDLGSAAPGDVDWG